MKDYDLFGSAFMDYFNGTPHPLYLERDDGHMDEQGMDIYFSDFENFQYPEQMALRYVKGRVLDIGVGAGRVALYLQSKGHKVVGIDLSDKALEVSKRRGVKNVLKMSACDLKFRKNSFDTAIAFCNNFGLCGNMTAVERMMGDLHRIVRPGGRFLASSIQPTRTKNPVHTSYHRRNRARGLPPGQVKLRERYQDRVGPWWDLLMVTPAEMKALCARTGWRIDKVYLGIMDVYVLSRV
jgi:SAM-dependent methyltransferase